MMFWLSIFACGAPVEAPENSLSSLSSGSVGAQTTRKVPPGKGPRAMVARISADVVAGTFPLTVSFDATQSQLPSGGVQYRWSFGDGAQTTGARPSHTYIGEGSFEARLTLYDPRNGAVSRAEVTIDVQAPPCPQGHPPLQWGHVSDAGLTEISGLAASRIDPDAWWVHEDSGNAPVLTALDAQGHTLSEYELPSGWVDFEDLAAAVDPETGTPLLFLGDIGDNGHSRSEIAVWIAEEPDPRTGGRLEPLRMALTYPDWPHNAESLLVDPLTLDIYIVTKEVGADARVFVKRAPHDSEGPFALEALGEVGSQALVATGGDISPDGSVIALRDYSDTAYLWVRDGYRPLEEAFDAPPCAIPIAGEQQGEAIAFTPDGAGLLTTSEGTRPALNFIGL